MAKSSDAKVLKQARTMADLPSCFSPDAGPAPIRGRRSSGIRVVSETRRLSASARTVRQNLFSTSRAWSATPEHRHTTLDAAVSVRRVFQRSVRDAMGECLETTAASRPKTPAKDAYLCLDSCLLAAEKIGRQFRQSVW